MNASYHFYTKIKLNDFCKKNEGFITSKAEDSVIGLTDKYNNNMEVICYEDGTIHSMYISGRNNPNYFLYLLVKEGEGKFITDLLYCEYVEDTLQEDKTTMKVTIADYDLTTKIFIDSIFDNKIFRPRKLWLHVF